MLRLFRRLMLFLLFLGPAWMALAFVSAHVPAVEKALVGAEERYGSTNLRIPEFVSWAERDEADFIVLGSSVCYRGIAPQAFEAYGLRGFNRCSTAQTFEVSLVQLDFALARVRPRFVLLDIYPSLWRRRNTEAARDLIINNNLVADPAFLRTALTTRDPFTVAMWAYYAWKRSWSPMEPLYPVVDGDRYEGLGFVHAGSPAARRWRCSTRFDVMSERQREPLRRMVDRLAAIEAHLILVIPPQICEERFEMPVEFRGLPIIDGFDWPLSSIDTLYYDRNHLRGIGAVQYSEWLAGQVVALLDSATAARSGT
jgi:hypothetical protein